MFKIICVSVFLMAFSSLAFGQGLLESANEKRLSGKYQEAIEIYTKVIQDFPNSARAFSERGYCYAKLHQYQASLNDLDKAIALEINDSLVYLNRGWAKYNLGQQAAACFDWQMALQLGYEGAQEILAEHCR